VAGEVTRMPPLAMKACAVVLLRRRRAGCERVGAERVVVHASRRANASIRACRAARMTAGLPMSPRINHVGGCFDDLPEGTVGAVVVDAPSVVWA